MKINKISGCLIGGAIGDALGYQIEFKKEIKDKEYTTYKNDKGVISDDTQMTLFTANGLLWRETRYAMRGIAPDVETSVYYSYLDWLETQDKYAININKVSWLTNVNELNVQRAPGNTCLSALASGKVGTLTEPINNSKGCGGVMRVAPIGLYAKNTEMAGEFGAKVSAITHGHIYSTLASFLFASIINIITYSDCTIIDAIKQALKCMKKFLKTKISYKRKNLKNFFKTIKLAIRLSKKQLDDTTAIKLIGEGCVAEETLAIALYSCLKHSTNFKDAIVCAVNHDGDSDSTGSIAGNIIGAYLGYDKIPNYYIDNLELKDIILEIAHDLSIPVPVSEYNKNNDSSWTNKYIYCEKETTK